MIATPRPTNPAVCPETFSYDKDEDHTCEKRSRCDSTILVPIVQIAKLCNNNDDPSMLEQLKLLTIPRTKYDLNWEKDVGQVPEPFCDFASLQTKCNRQEIQYYVSKERILK